MILIGETYTYETRIYKNYYILTECGFNISIGMFSLNDKFYEFTNNEIEFNNVYYHEYDFWFDTFGAKYNDKEYFNI